MTDDNHWADYLAKETIERAEEVVRNVKDCLARAKRKET